MERKPTSPYVLVLLLLLFPLAALGHDVWMMTDPAKRGWEFSRPFELSDLGWLWIAYAPDSFKSVYKSIPHELWMSCVDPILGKSSVYVLLVPPVATFCGIVAFRLYRRIRPLENSSKKAKDTRFTFRGLNEQD